MQDPETWVVSLESPDDVSAEWDVDGILASSVSASQAGHVTVLPGVISPLCVSVLSLVNIESSPVGDSSVIVLWPSDAEDLWGVT